MHLITQNKVTFNGGLHGTVEAHVKGSLFIETIATQTSMDLRISYAYLNADNEDAIIKSTSKVITEEEQTQLYNAVKDSLPDISADFGLWYKTLLYEAFRMEMANTFQVPINEINIVQ